MKGRALASMAATARRDWEAAFATPLASLFIAAFVAAASLLAFQIGGLFETGRADLQPFFQFLPWLFMIFMPALAMRSWAEEARSGTLEILLSLPVPTWTLVAGKFLALWGLAGLALLLTMPLWLLVSLLGPVDHGATAATYLVSFLVAGAYLAISCAMSAATSSQVIAFVLAVAVSFGFTAAGLPVATETLRAALGDAAGAAVAGFSLLDVFDIAQRGVIEARGLVYLVTLTGFWLALATLLVRLRRSDPA